MATSMEKATRCPKCEQPGDRGGTQPIDGMPGYQALKVFCRNEQCSWYDTFWVVQINPDGSIPDAAPEGKPRGKKLYPVDHPLTAGITNEMIQKVNRYAEHGEQIREI
jgi:hypothetical protein